MCLLHSRDTERDQIDRIIMGSAPSSIKPISRNSIKEINSLKDGRFGISFSSFILYANGRNHHSLATANKCGLYYFDGSNIFALGLFRKQGSTNESPFYLHIIAPVGPDAIRIAFDLIKSLQKTCGFPRACCYFRHLTKSQQEELMALGAIDISQLPWHPAAACEDETYNHRKIDISELLEVGEDGEICVKVLSSNGARNFRRKTRLAYNRYSNFLNRNAAHVEVYDYRRDVHSDVAKALVSAHFADITHAIGSTAEDYYNLIEEFPNPDEERGFIGKLGFLTLDEQHCRFPIMLFLGESIGKDTVGLYATFFRKNVAQTQSSLDLTGASAGAQFGYVRMLAYLMSEGYRYADLGGSETNALNEFKRQLGAEEVKTFWAVVQ